MSKRNDRKEPTPLNNEYTTHKDGRRRKKERILNAPFIDSNDFGASESYGVSHQPVVQFRISPFSHKVGSEVAALFGMSLSQYAKCCLYLNLGLVFERVDRRRKIK